MWNRKVIRASFGVASLVLISVLSTGEAGAAPSKTSYGLQVGAICRGYQSKLQAVGLALSSESTPQQLANELKRTIPMAQKGISKMSKIPQPKNDGRQLKAVFSSQRNELKKFKQLAKDIEANKETTVHVLLGTVNSVATKLKRQYGAAGLTECAAETSAAASTP